MPSHQNQPDNLNKPTHTDNALNVANAQRRDIQGAYGAEVLMGSDCGSCKEASSRRGTQGERDAGARVPSKLNDRPSGLVGFKKQRENILISSEDADLRRMHKMRRMVVGASEGIETVLQSDGYRYRVGFITLTYVGIDDWQPGDIKKHVRHFRLWAKRCGEPFRLVWVAKLQTRSALHYHLCFWH